MMIKHALFSRCGLLAALLSAVSMVQAASISLVPSTTSVLTGGSFTLDLLLDRTGVGGDTPGLFAGEVLVTYDPARLSLDAFLISASANLVSTSSSTNTFTVSFENAVDTASDPVINIGTFDFTAGLTTGVTNIDIKDAQDPPTSFANQLVGGVAGMTPFNPDPIGASVTVIPLPGALWLMLSGLGVLGLARRKA